MFINDRLRSKDISYEEETRKKEYNHNNNNNFYKSMLLNFLWYFILDDISLLLRSKSTIHVY